MKISSVLIIALLLGGIFMLFLHEQQHKMIFEDFGIKAHVEYFSHFPSVVTIAEEPCKSGGCILAHNNNDSIGYPLGIIYVVFGLFLYGITLLIETLLDLKIIEIRRNNNDS